MTSKVTSIVKPKLIDTAELDAAVADLEKALEQMKVSMESVSTDDAIDDSAVDIENSVEEMKAALVRASIEDILYAVNERPPEFDPNEPDDYESKTHGY